jgi:hypothetical protein
MPYQRATITGDIPSRKLSAAIAWWPTRSRVSCASM